MDSDQAHLLALLGSAHDAELSSLFRGWSLQTKVVACQPTPCTIKGLYGQRGAHIFSERDNRIHETTAQQSVTQRNCSKHLLQTTLPCFKSPLTFLSPLIPLTPARSPQVGMYRMQTQALTWLTTTSCHASFATTTQ